MSYSKTSKKGTRYINQEVIIGQLELLVDLGMLDKIKDIIDDWKQELEENEKHNMTVNNESDEL